MASSLVRRRGALLGCLCLVLAQVGCATSELPRAPRGTAWFLDEAGARTCGGPAERWALVIGVDRYEDARIPTLSGAVLDAWTFYHYLGSPDGGGVPPDRLLLLLNEEATRANVDGALGNWLSAACPQDEVLVFFAGHGAPEPGRPEEAFLLVHDSRLDNMVGSAVSMSRMYDFLRWRADQAGTLLLLIDACHSGSIVFPSERGVRTKEGVRLATETRTQQVASGLERMVEQVPGWGVMSAAAADQLAQEQTCAIGASTYQGGLFTCAMLDGLLGAADGDGDGRVTLREAYSHLRLGVLNRTAGAQVPQLSGTVTQELVLGPVRRRPVAIPPLPEMYTREPAFTDGSWPVWATGAAAIAVGTAGIVFNLLANDAAGDLNVQGRLLTEPEYDGLLEDRNQNRQLALWSYGGAGLLSVVAALIGGWKVIDPVETREDIYDRGPWIILEGPPASAAPPLSDPPTTP